MEHSRQLEAELEWTKEVADRLERVNQNLVAENTRLKSQFKSQEEDRDFLIKQLVTVKKDNARLRIEYTALEQELKSASLYANNARVSNTYTYLINFMILFNLFLIHVLSPISYININCSLP